MRFLLKLLALAVALIVVYELWIFAQVWWWSSNNPRSTAFMDASLALLREKDPRAQLQQQWVPYQRISVHLKRAVIASEDAKFADHEGFDWDAIEKAYEKNLQKGRIVAGGSTISQQLAKNLFLSGDRSPLRKGQEAIITLMLERMMTKRRILEIYLNVIEWGNGVFGAEAAARHYFNTSAANLGPGEAAWLAAIVPNPRFYDGRRSTPWIQRKTQIIRARMGAAEVP